MSAAHQLQRFGFEVVVVEARDRVGGRVATGDLGGTKVDLGAMIITGVDKNPMTMLCRQLGLRTMVIEMTCKLYDMWGTVPEDSDVKVEGLFNKALDTIAKKSRKAADSKASKNRPEDASLGALLEQQLSTVALSEQEVRVMNWHIANLEYGCGAELDKVSLPFWDQDDVFAFGGDHCLLPHGYERMSKALATGLDVRLGCPVEAVNWSNDEPHGEKSRLKHSPLPPPSRSLSHIHYTLIFACQPAPPAAPPPPPPLSLQIESQRLRRGCAFIRGVDLQTIES